MGLRVERWCSSAGTQPQGGQRCTCGDAVACYTAGTSCKLEATSNLQVGGVEWGGGEGGGVEYECSEEGWDGERVVLSVGGCGAVRLAGAQGLTGAEKSVGRAYRNTHPPIAPRVTREPVAPSQPRAALTSSKPRTAHTHTHLSHAIAV